MKHPLPKVWNLRILPTLALYLVLGILLATIDVWWLIVLIGIVVAICTTLFFCLAIKRHVVGILCVLMLTIGFSTMARTAQSVRALTIPTEYCVVEGQIVGVDLGEDGMIRNVILDNLTIADTPTSGLLYAYLPKGKYALNTIQSATETLLAVGDIVLIECTPEVLSPQYFDSYSVHRLAKNQVYSARPTVVTTIGHKKLPLMAEARQHLYDTLLSNTTPESAGFLYGMLTGESRMPQKALLAFRQSGTAHLLAVSGLHVSALAGVLLWVLKRCRLRKGWCTTILTLLLTLYAWFCGFTPSVLRASVLVIYTSLSAAFGARRDAVSGLSLSAILLLAIKPIWLFDVSFLLSYGAYLGIVLLYPILNTALKRVPRFPAKLREGICIDLAVSLSLLPLSIYFFEGYALFSPILNLVVVPFASLFYVVLLAAALLVLIIPSTGIVITGLGWIAWALQRCVSTVGAVGFIPCKIGVAGLPLWALGMTACSPYLMTKRWIKLTATGVLFASGIALSILFA